MTDSNVTLLPCPFCGGEAELKPTYDLDTDEIDGWFAWCCTTNDCTTHPMTNDYLTRAEAVEAWNTRAERTCHNIWNVELTGRLRFQCSECGAVSLEITPRYCPSCGAKVVEP